MNKGKNFSSSAAYSHTVKYIGDVRNMLNNLEPEAGVLFGVGIVTAAEALEKIKNLPDGAISYINIVSYSDMFLGMLNGLGNES